MIAPAWPAVTAGLRPWLAAQVQYWQRLAGQFDGECTALTAQLERQGRRHAQPKGLGGLSAAVLDAEIGDWRRFHNRRQIGSYTGRCPGESTSDRRQRQGGVTKHGNPRLRHCLIEAAWRMAQWQPQYPPLARLYAATSKRARKRAIVLVGRRLIVDLWRIRTGQCAAAPLGLQMQEG